ncbi:MAG: chromosome segregation protein SMC [Planctomycetota bacterium]
MKLNSLEVHGFKSFAEKTVIEFTSGVTAIVGPNGCGKSNVVDAVKWVLGEQSIKSLRGREMTDVIFNGSERRPAMNMAEATLTFDNEDRTLDLDESEVAITRRLYRSGESDYLINHKSCRLRDVRELLMGTGLGPGGYSFMEQGKIDSVLASNPVDRRKVFEEAAGISRFRARRHEAELKLEKVDANLLRLADIIDELERRERSLKIQAGKAERYREASQRARELQAKVAVHRFRENRRAQIEIEKLLDERRGRRDELGTARDEKRGAYDEINEQLAEVNEALSLERETAADIRAREKGAREMAEFHRRHLEDLVTRAEGREHEIHELEKDLELSAGESEQQSADQASLDVAVKQKRERVAEMAQEVGELRKSAHASESQIRAAGEQFDALVRRRTEVERETARREADETRWRDETARADERLEELEREVERLQADILSAKKSSEASHDSLRGKREKLAQSESEVESQRDTMREAEEAQRLAVAERSRVESRREVLQGHILRHEGLEEGVRKLLAARKAKSDFLPGCKGLLLDLIAVERSQANAIEAALGDAAQALVVETVAEAMDGARVLQKNGKGRAAFLPLECFEGANDAQVSLPAGVSIREGLSAADTKRLEGLLKALIGGVMVCEFDELENELSRGAKSAKLIATRRGDLVREGRLFRWGGASNAQGLLAVRSELEELEEAAVRSQREVARIKSSLADLEDARERADGALKSLRQEAREEEGRVHALNHEWKGLEASRERLEAERARLTSQRQNSESKLATLAQARELAMVGLAELEARLKGAEESRAATLQDRDSSRESLDSSAGQLEIHRVELASDEQRLQGLNSSLSHLTERHSRASRGITRYRDELTAFAADRDRSAKLAQEEKAKSSELQTEGEAIVERTKAKENDVAEVRSRHEIVGKEIRDVERAFEEAAEAFHAADVQANEIRVNQENLVSHVRAELEVDLAELESRQEAEAADAAAAEGGSPGESGDELDGRETEAETEPEVDWAAVEAELNELKDRLRRLGNVNLAAIDDLDEVQERLEFLVAQRNDLVHSKQQLGRVLGNIEEESTRLFRETFDNVRREFQLTFRKLFGGGKADIVLTDPDNILESGIEITARPPGKEMRSIELLSGGERTLTAVSLLFSIIRSHPCPCCLMDEVDAALDEDNTERFGQLLDEFYERTQFILITHSRRTMARADVLFGVTMGERGVSRPVAVRFEDVDDHGNIAGENSRRKRPPAKPSSPRPDQDGGAANSAGKSTSPGPGENPGFTDSGRNGHANGSGSSDEPQSQGGLEAPGSEVIVEVSEAAAPDDEGGQVFPASDPRSLDRERHLQGNTEPEQSAEEGA